MTFPRSAAVLAVLIAIAAPSAHAGVVGPSAPAEVTCDYMTNQIKIQARIGASASYNTQTVAYELYLYNATTAKWIDLDVGPGQNWEVRVHNRVTSSREWSIPDNAWIWQSMISVWAPTSLHTYVMPDGRYDVYTRYIWEAGGFWYDANGARFNANSPWLMTTTYSGWGYGNHLKCSL